MPTQIKPSDTYTSFLVELTRKPAPAHIKKLLPKYRITHFLGAGGFADVYEGSDKNGWAVAIKVPQFKMKKTMDSSTLKRFTTEAEMWTKLQHDNIVQVYNTGSKPLPDIVMELLEGGDLEGLMKEHSLTMEEAVHIMAQILEGLSYAHQMATVHRDLKPENILFAHDGIAKITDWGIGKYMASEGITKTIETKGTLAYSAPEQFDSQEYGKVDWQTDIFQIGILFYGMLTGVNPFHGKDMAEVMGKVLRYDPAPPSELNSEIPTELDEIVMGALEKYKEDRWDSSAVMLHELKLIIKGKVRTKRRERKAEKLMYRVREQVDVMDDLYRYMEMLKDFNIDTERYNDKLKTVEEYAKLRWYDKVRETGTPLLDELKDEYGKAEEERRAPLRPMIKYVRNIFEKCITRKINVDDLYSLNEDAMEAFEKMDLKRSEDLFDKLRKELKNKIDNDDRVKKQKKKAWRIYNSLKINPYGVAPPEDLKSVIESDVTKAIKTLREWKDAVDVGRKIIEKAKELEEKRKRREIKIEDNRKRFIELRSNPYLPPPDGLEELVVNDVSNTTEEKLKEWEDAIEQSKIEEAEEEKKQRERKELKKRVEELSSEVARLREKTHRYKLDMQDAGNLIQSAFTLYIHDQLHAAEDKFIVIKKELGTKIEEYEAKEEDKRERLRRYRKKKKIKKKAFVSIIVLILIIVGCGIVEYIFYKWDSDGDGVRDAEDLFPHDPAASIDTDNDGSPDEWNEGKNQKDSTSKPTLHLDAFPNDPSASIDTDKDDFPDEWNVGKRKTNSTTGLHLDKFRDDPAASIDSDGDGFPDAWNQGKTQINSTTGLKIDQFPYNKNEWADEDEDGHGDNKDDKFPGNSDEWADEDGDGYGDNKEDAFPKDRDEWSDTDGDGVGDNSDLDPYDKTIQDFDDLVEVIYIPSGTFWMGSFSGEGDDDEHPRHQVTISKSFQMLKYEVTQSQWKAVMGNNPSLFSGDNNPVETVSWSDCQSFISKVNELSQDHTYRLPTEVEWEYACRAGSTTTYSYGNDSAQLGQYAWCSSNSDRKTHSVGGNKANAWGLYDMHGNVWEWCQDWYNSDYYDNSPSTDPQGPNSGTYHVIRGGGWNSYAEYCRSADRNDAPYGGYDNIGLRLVRT